MDFQYTENRRSIIRSMRAYEFETLINKVYDAASGALHGIISFINNHIELITVDKSEKLFIPFCLLASE